MKANNPDPNRLTISAIAALLAATRTTVRRHLRLPGSPPRGKDGCYDRTLALRFLRGSISKGGAGASALEQLRTRRLEIEIEKAELELARVRGQVWSRDAILPALEAHVREFQSLFYQRITQELPPRVIGKGLIEVQLLLQDACDRLIHELKTGGKNFVAQVGGPAPSGKGGYGS